MFRLRKAPPMTLSLICAACTGLLAALYGSGFAPWLQAELAWKDLLIRYGRKAPQHPEIVYLAIDQASVSLDGLWPDEIAASPALRRMKESGWPWTRDVYPFLIERLVGAGAKVVAFDLLFPTSREGDDAFRTALENYRDHVVIGSNFVDAEREGDRTSSIHALPSSTVIPPALQGGMDPRIGFVNFWPDIDGVVRRAHYRRTVEDVSGHESSEESTELLSFAARILAKTGRADLIPPGRSASMFRFAAAPDQSGFLPRSVFEILVDRFWASPPYNGGAFFKDKIVVIGPEGNWSKDVLSTPFGPMPGPEVHLNALNAALQGEFPVETSRTVNLILIFAAGAAAWLLSALIDRPVLRFFVYLGMLLAFYGAVQLAYNLLLGGGRWAVLLSPAVALTSSAGVWLVWEQVLQRLEKRRTRKMLERYVSKNVVSEILDNPASFMNTLGGVRRPVAIMFTDLRGFTAMTEQAESQQLVLQLNEYFSEMVKCVFSENGTLDKFIGDAIMAIWGNVQTEGPKRDVIRCVTAALKMRRALAELNTEWTGRGMPSFAMGFGINHGEAIVGNIGSSEKMELTVIGDPVNLASRLEGLTKGYKVDMILGEAAGELARDTFYLQFVDHVRVMGRSKPAKVYTVLGARSDPLEPATAEALTRYEEAMAKYAAHDFHGAEGLLRRVLDLRPHDPLAALYVERSTRLQAEPPAPDWDGVYVATSK